MTGWWPGLPLAAIALALAFLSPAGAADTPPSSELPDLTAIRREIYIERYDAAIAELTTLVETHQHADLYNLLAFSLRHVGRTDEAEKWYRQALYYDPDHKGALEYQGELFLAQGKLDRARANLDKLAYLCPDGCDEARALEFAIAEAEGKVQAAAPRQ